MNRYLRAYANALGNGAAIGASDRVAIAALGILVHCATRWRSTNPLLAMYLARCLEVDDRLVLAGIAQLFGASPDAADSARLALREVVSGEPVITPRSPIPGPEAGSSPETPPHAR